MRWAATTVLRSGMKTDKGNIVHYFEALKNNSVALTINGDNGAIRPD